MSFSGPLKVLPCPEASRIFQKEMFVVTEEFKWHINRNCWVNVPRGFLTDGASVPNALKGVMPPLAKYGQAAVLHDYLCEFLSVTNFGGPLNISRKAADEYFEDAMHYLGVDEITLHLMSSAVAMYREVYNINAPSSTRIKRDMEAKWAQENP